MIPASLLIILIPLIAALPAYVLRRWRAIETLIAMLACAAVVVLLARPGETLTLGGLTIDTGAPVNVLGRVLTVRTPDRAPLVLLFGLAALLFILGWGVSQGWTYVPLGLGILALLSAGLLIRPFVFAALAFEAAAALAAIMVQAERNGPASTGGALRYLVLTTLALPAFLGAGYAVNQASVITDPAQQVAAYGPAVILLVIGVLLIFGAFPLFTWTHPVAKDAPPLTTAFLAAIGGGAATFFFLSFQQEFAWFRDSATVSTWLNVVGIATLLFGGLLGWAQRSFGRVLACGLSVDVGSTLLLLSRGTPFSVEAAAFGILARAVSLGLLGLGLALLRSQADGSDEFAQVRGCGRQLPWAALALALGGLSLAGLPGTVGFVARWSALRVLGQNDLEVLVLTVLAGASVGAGLWRGLAALFAPSEVLAPTVDATTLHQRVRRRAMLAIVLALVLAVGLGLGPGLVAPVTKAISTNYTFYK
jgi:multicomponent Na+:H+ antiporter subunit D